MTKLYHVKKARKDIPGTDIKRGDSYYWWQFAFRSKQVSKTHPRRSQYMTQSEHLGAIYDLEDTISSMKLDDVDSNCIDSITSEIQSIMDTCQERLDNMPEQLQDAPAGQTLQEYIDNLESWMSDLESVDLSELDNNFDELAKGEVDEEQFLEDGVLDEEGYVAALNEKKSELEENAKEEALDAIQACTYPG